MSISRSKAAAVLEFFDYRPRAERRDSKSRVMRRHSYSGTDQSSYSHSKGIGKWL